MQNFHDLIYYIDISHKDGTDLFHWELNKGSFFQMDLIAARSSASKDYFQRIDKMKVRIVFIKYKSLIFTIGGSIDCPTQYLEAVLESTINKFTEMYAALFELSISSGTDMYSGFAQEFQQLILNVEKNGIVSLKVPCKMCNTVHKIYVKKALVEKSDKFPVSFVYYHKGEGLLIYIDANFKVRGVEVVAVAL